MSGKEKTILWCDRVMAFSFYALIYFLPISIALAEIFTALALVCYLLKRATAFFGVPRRREEGWFVRSFSKNRIVLFIKAFKPIDNDLNIPITVFLFFNALSVLVGQYPKVGWEGFFGKSLQSAFIYFTFIECINSRRRLKIFLNVFFVSCLLICTNGIYQSIIGQGFIHGHIFDGRISSSLRHANDFSAYLVVVIPILLGAMLSYITYRRRIKGGQHEDFFISRRDAILSAFLFIVAVVSLGLTYSRGAWVGFLLAMFYFGLKRKRIMLISGLVMILFLGIFYPQIKGFRKVKITNDSKVVKQIVSKAAESDDLKASFYEEKWSELLIMVKSFGGSGRVLYWKEASNIIQDKPLFGVGLNAYSLAAPKYKITWGGYPHNCYLQMLSEIGIPGFMCFLWLLFRIFRNTTKHYKRLKNSSLGMLLLGSAAGLIGFLTQSFFDTSFYSVQLGSLLWINIGLVASLQSLNGKANAEAPKEPRDRFKIKAFRLNKAAQRLLIVLVLIFVGQLYYAKKITRNKKYGPVFFDVGVNCRNCSFDKKLKYYNKALYHDSTLSKAYYEIGNLYMKKGNEKKGLEYYQKTADCDHRHLEAYMKLGLYYFRNGQYDYAERYLRQAVSINSGQTNVNWDLGIIYEAKNEYEEAIKCYRRIRKYDKEHYEKALAKIGALYHRLQHSSNVQSVVHDLRKMGRDDLADQLELFKETGQLPEFMKNADIMYLKDQPKR